MNFFAPCNSRLRAFLDSTKQIIINLQQDGSSANEYVQSFCKLVWRKKCLLS